LELKLKMYKNSSDEYTFFEFRKDSLDFAKEAILGNTKAGVTTPEIYTQDLKKFLSTSQQHLKEVAQRLGE